MQNRKSLRGGFVDPFTRLADAFGDLFGGSRFGSGLHGIWALMFLALLVVVIRRFPASYSAYTGAVLVLTLTARNLDSFERYGMSTFPLLLALAYATRREGVDRAALVISAAALAGYAVLGVPGPVRAVTRRRPHARTRRRARLVDWARRWRLRAAPRADPDRSPSGASL